MAKAIDKVLKDLGLPSRIIALDLNMRAGALTTAKVEFLPVDQEGRPKTAEQEDGAVLETLATEYVMVRREWFEGLSEVDKHAATEAWQR